MDKLDAFIDWMLLDLPKRVPGAVIAAIALLLYPGLAIVVPVSLGLTGSWLISVNIVGTTLAACVALGWLLLQIEARDRRHLLDWTTDLRLLDAAEFEWLVGELFRREGWTVEETGHQATPDGNVDLRLAKGDERRIAQCKRWVSWQVGVKEVRAFAGTLARERLPMSAGMFVTLSSFSEQAREEARTLGLTLLDGRDLVARIQRVRRAEHCPVCTTPMVLDRSSRGWWFRCRRFPECDGKRDLGSDLARAVGLLTQQR